MSLEKLARDLRTASNRVQRDVAKVVKRGAQNIKTDWQEQARDYKDDGSARMYPRSISYDANGTHAEIGPDKGRTQGALGNLIEFGSVNNAPTNMGGRALERELPKFEKAIADLGEI